VGAQLIRAGTIREKKIAVCIVDTMQASALAYSGLHFLIHCYLVSDCAAWGPTYPKFRDHHTNTQAMPNEQTGTAVLEQPLSTRAVGSLLNKQGKL
jgi:hypothetical protein